MGGWPSSDEPSSPWASRGSSPRCCACAGPAGPRRRVAAGASSRARTCSDPSSPHRPLMRALVVGAGAVGARAVRQLVESPEVDEVAIVDTDPVRQAAIVESSGTKAVVGSPEEPADGVLLAGPCGTHAQVARHHATAGRVVVSTSDAMDDVRALLALDEEAT